MNEKFIKLKLKLNELSGNNEYFNLITNSNKIFNKLSYENKTKIINQLKEIIDSIEINSLKYFQNNMYKGIYEDNNICKCCGRISKISRYVLTEKNIFELSYLYFWYCKNIKKEINRKLLMNDTPEYLFFDKEKLKCYISIENFFYKYKGVTKFRSFCKWKHFNLISKVSFNKNFNEEILKKFNGKYGFWELNMTEIENILINNSKFPKYIEVFNDKIFKISDETIDKSNLMSFGWNFDDYKRVFYSYSNYTKLLSRIEKRIEFIKKLNSKIHNNKIKINKIENSIEKMSSNSKYSFEVKQIKYNNNINKISILKSEIINLKSEILNSKI